MAHSLVDPSIIVSFTLHEPASLRKIQKGLPPSLKDNEQGAI